MKPGMQWPIGIAVILAVGVVANIVVMRIANSDPSFAVEPDYYQKAVDFDSTLAHANTSAKLHWISTTTVTRGDRGDSTHVTITLQDSLGHAIEQAAVSVEALAIARANTVLTATLREQAPGEYTAPLPVPRGGLWDITIHATRNDDHFVEKARIDIDQARKRSAPPAVDSIAR